MNTNRINNKNTKRIAIAAGAAAAALFLTAGFVASRGNGSNNESDTPVLKVPAPVMEIAAAPQVEELTTEVQAAPVADTKSESASTAPKAPAAKTTKKAKSKKSPVLTGGLVSGGPAAVEQVTATPAPETTVAAAPQVAEAAVVEAPAVTVPAEQPAVNQPVAEQAPAPTATGGTTRVNIPQIIGTPNLASKIAGIDLSKLTSPQITIPKPCIPGLSC